MFFHGLQALGITISRNQLVGGMPENISLSNIYENTISGNTIIGSTNILGAIQLSDVAPA